MVASTILLFGVRNFFDIHDYEVLKKTNDKEKYFIDTDYGSINLGVDDSEKI